MRNRVIRVTELLLAAAELLFLLVTARAFLVRTEEHRFLQEDMELQREGVETQPAFYVDDSFDGMGRSIVSPVMELDRGIYAVTVEYLTDNPEDGRTGVWSVAEGGSAVKSDENRLPAQGNTLRYRVYVYQGKQSVCIRNYIHDDRENYLLIHAVTVTYLRKLSAAYALVRLLFFFLLLDLLLYFFVVRGRRTRGLLRKNALVTVVLAAVLFLSQYALLVDYIPYGDDLMYHGYRLQQLGEGLKNGYFPVRLQPGWMNGYGYAPGIFYGDLFLYPAALLSACGVPTASCYRLYILLCNAATAGVSYFAFRKMSGRKITALLGCVLYSLSMYRLANLYTRAAAGEFTAMIFLPLLVLGFWTLCAGEEEDKAAAKRPDTAGWLYLTAGATGVLESHMLSVLMVALFGLLFGILAWKRMLRRRTLLSLGKFVLATLLLNASYIVPFLDYYIHLDIRNSHMVRNLAGRSIQIADLFAVFPQTSGVSERTPFTLGLALGACVLPAVLMLLLRAFGKNQGLVRSVLCLNALALLMCTRAFPYEWIRSNVPPLYHVLQNLQYPWRLLEIATILSVTLFVYAMPHFEDRYGRSCLLIAGGFLCMTAVYQGVSYQSAFLNENPREETLYYFSDSFCQSGGEYLLEGTNVERLKTDTAVRAVREGAVLLGSVGRKGLSMEVEAENLTDQEETVEFPLFAYPGYRAEEAGTGLRLETGEGDNHRVAVRIPAGFQGRIRVFFQEPVLWRAAELLTLAAWIGGIVYLKRVRKCKIVESVEIH
ncbi:hypothetical protein [Lachnoclostridium sp. Marseille-P6806]|uniref:hypothetical protein n=1 Tax=Lachnoclostridium sp. Marseille-P6806 TaxID=2364793 RepID=UPI0010312BF4|nr:hypothetical protein [Lachnoclostridium sp. Marseille-P6806]